MKEAMLSKLMMVVVLGILLPSSSSSPTVVREEALSSADGPLIQPSRACGEDIYNTDERYICRQNLRCPIINGEALSLCGDACYSQYMYMCTRTGTNTTETLQMRPPLDPGGSITLRAETHRYADSMPSAPLPSSSPSSVDGLPMTACHLAWSLGGSTCSYCPAVVVGTANCPAGNTTALAAGANAMDVEVPGGQQFFLTDGRTVGYTQAHSMAVPPGSTMDGFRAFEGGGFFNLLDGAWGWAACPEDEGEGEGEEKRWTLHVKNSTNAGELADCVGLNLRVESFDGLGAWQYE